MEASSRPTLSTFGAAEIEHNRYLVLRRDLQEKEAWPLGALVAQGAHAAVAAVAESITSEDTAAYVAPDASGPA